MSRVDPEASHKRLATIKFISSDADIALFEDLRLRCESLRDPDEQLPTVQYQEAEAWRRQYNIYLKLKKRAAVADSDPVTAQWAANNSLVEEEWNNFARQRAEFLEWLKREPNIDAELREYVGLRPGDLDPPTIEDDVRFAGARKPNWRDIASRISTAMWKLKNMGIAERMNVPNVIQTRRLVDAVNSISEKLKTFEEKFDWLDARISAVESKSIDRKH